MSVSDEYADGVEGKAELDVNDEDHLEVDESEIDDPTAVDESRFREAEALADQELPRNDPLDQEGRRRLMSRVRTRDTAPELRLRRALWAAGTRGWRVDAKRVYGKPDLAWIGLRLAVFVDGGFWHGHPDVYHGQSGPFWDEKIARNRTRDDTVNARLKGDGWTVLRLWDFDVQRDIEGCVGAVQEAISVLRAE